MLGLAPPITSSSIERSVFIRLVVELQNEQAVTVLASSICRTSRAVAGVLGLAHLARRGPAVIDYTRRC